MSGTAVFLGAGASRAFGYPVTASLLPLILSRLDDETAFDKGIGEPIEIERAEDKRGLLRRLIEAIGPGVDADAPQASIGDLLSLADYALRSSSALVPGFRVEELTRCRSLLEEAIIEVLARRWHLESNPHLLRNTASWLRGLASPDAPSAVISTNYDTGLDWEYLAEIGKEPETFAQGVDLGFSWRECESGRVRLRPHEPRARLFKLHGSLNWVRCELCEHVYVNPRDRNLAARLGYGEICDWNTCHCGHAPLRALLVAPSTVRDVRDPSLLEVWKSSLEFLRNATRWILIGYSLPVEDIGIRSLFVRAAHAREGSRPEVLVIQKATGDSARDRETVQRYRALFPGCQYTTDGLEAFIDSLEPPAGASPASRPGGPYAPRSPAPLAPGARPA